MKNLNALVKEGKTELSGLMGGLPIPKSVQRWLEDFARKVAETALKECRPEKKNEKGTGIYKDMLGIEEMGYNQCLSDYDEKVKQFLQ